MLGSDPPPPVGLGQPLDGLAHLAEHDLHADAGAASFLELPLAPARAFQQE